MKDKYVIYQEIKNKASLGIRENKMKTEIYYNIGGYNYFTGEKTQRGYYVSVGPVEQTEVYESVVAFSSYCFCLFKVNRKSKKQMERAINEYKEVAEMIIKNKFPNYELGENEVRGYV